MALLWIIHRFTALLLFTLYYFFSFSSYFQFIRVSFLWFRLTLGFCWVFCGSVSRFPGNIVQYFHATKETRWLDFCGTPSERAGLKKLKISSPTKNALCMFSFCFTFFYFLLQIWRWNHSISFNNSDSRWTGYPHKIMPLHGFHQRTDIPTCTVRPTYLYLFLSKIYMHSEPSRP